MPSIVVIEDNDNLRHSVVRTLAAGGHHVAGVESAEAFIEAPPFLDPDMLVIGLDLPGEDGLSFAARIRTVHPAIGIVMLAGYAESGGRAAGYNSGADICLTDPVPPDELEAAVKALSRRLLAASPTVPHSSVILRRRTLSGSRGDVRLSAVEAALLTGLLRAPDRRLETWQIGELLGNGADIPERNAINVAIFRINRKIERSGGAPRSIRAIRNWGYQLATLHIARSE